MNVEAKGLDYRALNEAIRAAGPACRINGCLGQRFIGAGMSGRQVEIHGIPGNALGAYLGGGSITVCGNAQDAVGDTMNDGSIIIHGNVGDTVGYAMRGGEIYVQGNAGYRVGIHMKAYQDKQPVIVIGAGPAYRRQAHRRVLPLHGAARRQGDLPGGCFRHPLPGPGDAPSAHGGGAGAAAALGGALVRPVRRRCGGFAGRSLHRGNAGQQEPLPADVCRQLTNFGKAGA